MTSITFKFPPKEDLLRTFNEHPLTSTTYKNKQVVDEKLAQIFAQAELDRKSMYGKFFSIFAHRELKSLSNPQIAHILRNYIPALKEAATGEPDRIPLHRREVIRAAHLWSSTPE